MSSKVFRYANTFKPNTLPLFFSTVYQSHHRGATLILYRLQMVEKVKKKRKMVFLGWHFLSLFITLLNHMKIYKKTSMPTKQTLTLQSYILLPPPDADIIISLSKHQFVSEWVSLCVWMFPNSSETANPSELKFWGMIPLGNGKVLG